MTERLLGNEIDWLAAPTFGRRRTVLDTLTYLCRAGEAPTIVETGTARAKGGAHETDGWSTVAWAWSASQLGGTVYTVDLDPVALDVCRGLTKHWCDCVNYVHSDSVEFLIAFETTYKRKIDLLYLDSLDYDEPERSEAHCLAEARAALPHLARQCLILIDDTRKTEAGLTGKGTRAVPFLLDEQFKLEWSFGGQVLLSRGYPDELYPFGITAIVHTRNEAHQIVDCLETLKGWTDEIIVCDNTSLRPSGLPPPPLHHQVLAALSLTLQTIFKIVE